jgi:CBS domain-containing protein
MRISRILQRKSGDIASVEPERPILDVVAILCQRDIGAVLVLDSAQQMVGIVSERDIVRALDEHGPDLSGVTAADLMTRDVKHGAPDQDINHVMREMTEGRFRHLPILDDGRLIGIISIGDAVRARIEELEREREALQHYIAG